MGDTQGSASAPFPFFCDMAALSPTERASHQGRSARLFGELVREICEHADGFAYRFDGEQYPLLAAFIADERRCCPFLSFQLEVAAAHGPLWLRLSGPDGVKPFLADELGHDGPPL